LDLVWVLSGGCFVVKKQITGEGLTSTPTMNIRTYQFALCFLAVVAFSACSPPARRSKPSNPEAKQKYDLAVQYLARNQPNWAVDEAVDIVIRYPASKEALLSAVLLMDKCDHIGFQQFYVLTGYHLPVGRDLPRAQLIDILQAEFQ
jgi:hypothetical protein